MSNKPNTSDIRVKDYLSTMDDAMSVVMYNRLIRACTDAGGDYAVLAEDGTMLWRYAGAAVSIINAPFEFARPADAPDVLFNNFAEWCDLPSDVSSAILKAAERTQPVIDPVKAPPGMVSEETKND